MSRRSRPSEMRFLIAAFEVPAHGGASTAAYALCRKMQISGLDVHLVNIIDEVDVDYFRFIFREQMGNPAGLPNVHNCVINQSEFRSNPMLTELPALVADIAPDVMLGMDVIPSYMLKKVAAETPLIFLACGSDQARWYLEKGAVNDMISLRKVLQADTFPPEILPCREVEAMRMSELVLANAGDLRDLLRHFYPAWAGKVGSRPIWFAEWICEEAKQYKMLARPFADREFDVLFVASLWNRQVKNYSLVADIMTHCRDLKFCIVGEMENEPWQAACTGFVSSRREMFSIMGNARSVVSTSNMDCAPGILFEAVEMGCNIVASRNCGNWGLCHEDLLVDPYDLEGYVRAIRQSVMRRYADNLDGFLSENCFQELIDTMAVLRS